MPGRNQDDFDLESAFSDDGSLDNLFNESDDPKPGSDSTPAASDRSHGASIFDEIESDSPSIDSNLDQSIDFSLESDPVSEERKRSSKDFELDMDAILITAQSSMIMEGIQCYSEKDFSSTSLPIYSEALKGIDLYIKIIDRNPNNYNKLKKLIDSDFDCQRVENTVFNLFKKVFHRLPDDNSEKILAFEKFRQLFENAMNKATISTSSKMIKKYHLISGGLDEKKISTLINNREKEIISDMNALMGHIQIAIDMVNKGNFEIVKGLRGKDLNAYIINGTMLLYFYYNKTGNAQVAAHYRRIHENFKKYFITK